MAQLDIDSLSFSLSQEISVGKLEKMLPPKLLYRFRKWMRGHMHTGQDVSGMVAQKFEEISHETLAKNEVMASFFDNGIVKMDFGSDVDSKVKDAAMKWAKRRGLNAVEASLNKSSDAQSFVVFSIAADFGEYGTCKKRLRWTT